MKKTSATKRQTERSAEDLAVACAEMLGPAEPPDLAMEFVELPGLGPLYDTLCDRVARHEGYTMPTDDALVALEEQLQAALPEDQRGLVAQYSDLRGEREEINRTAAYHVGVAVGRRMYGGAR